MDSKNYRYFDTLYGKGVLLIEMNRLEKRNAFSPEFIYELCNIWDYIENESHIKVGVLKSKSEEFFSAGADLDKLIPLITKEKKPESKIEKKVLEENLLNKFYRKNQSYKKPIIGVSSGYCLAGGFELLLSCDFRIISSDSIIGFPETKIGLIPAGGGISRVTKATSRSRALEILINSTELDVYKLLNDGLVNEVCLRENLTSVLTIYLDKLLNSQSKPTEILIQNIDKFNALNLEDSFLLEEDLLNQLSNEK
jgi:enoyl-CoA hydratase